MGWVGESPRPCPYCHLGKDQGWEAVTPLIYACESPTVPLLPRVSETLGQVWALLFLFGVEVG